MNTNVVFLEDNYIMHRKTNDRFDFRELSDTPIELLKGRFNPIENVLKITTSPLLDTLEPRCSGRIVRALDRFMFLGESICDEYDLDHSKRKIRSYGSIKTFKARLVTK